MKGLMGKIPMGVKPMGPKPMVKAPKPLLTLPAGKGPRKVSNAKVEGHRPSGQFQGKRESTGKMNGGGYGDASHPADHKAFEKL